MKQVIHEMKDISENKSSTRVPRISCLAVSQECNNYFICCNILLSITPEFGHKRDPENCWSDPARHRPAYKGEP